MFSLLLVVLGWTAAWYNGSAVPVARCHPANHICEGKCPDLPSGAELPAEEDQRGLCLKDSQSDGCVCWLKNPAPGQQLQTLFKCKVVSNNNTVRHVMCLPPPICFPPSNKPGCLIVRDCPCSRHGPEDFPSTFGTWRPVVAFIMRSRTPVSTTTIQEEESAENSEADVRDFSLKHLLFLLAFVVAPLLCWCLLTFFHEGKCKKKSRTPETEPMPTDRHESMDEPQAGSCGPVQAPTAPKFESPPPYLQAANPSESTLLAADCGPPPSYEDAIRDQWYRSAPVLQETDSE